MQQRRFTRLINGFQKEVQNEAAADALSVAHENLVAQVNPGRDRFTFEPVQSADPPT
jgi:hypothetical protein